jgi:hypothetical protein
MMTDEPNVLTIFGAGMAGQLQQVARCQEVSLTAAQQRAGKRRVILDGAFDIGLGKGAQATLGKGHHVMMSERREQFADESRRVDEGEDLLLTVLIHRRYFERAR